MSSWKTLEKEWEGFPLKKVIRVRNNNRTERAKNATVAGLWGKRTELRVFFFFFDKRGCLGQLTCTSTNSTDPGANNRVNTLVPPRGFEPVTSGYPTLGLYSI